jgi:hypothetical protein
MEPTNYIYLVKEREFIKTNEIYTKLEEVNKKIQKDFYNIQKEVN